MICLKFGFWSYKIWISLIKLLDFETVKSPKRRWKIKFRAGKWINHSKGFERNQIMNLEFVRHINQIANLR